MYATTNVAAAVRSNLEQLEQEAQFLSGSRLAPARERDLARIQARIEDLRKQLALIGR